MNHWKSALSLALVPAFALTLLSGCQQTAAPPAESSSTSKGGHVIAANTWGVGAYPLDIIFEALTPLETSAGDLSIDLANNEFKVDKVVTDLQNQLTSGADGVLFLGMSQTIFPTVAQLCQNFEVPFVFHANIPADADWPAIQENAYYTGAVISQEYAAGAAMGELGLADGNQTAIISAAAKRRRPPGWPYRSPPCRAPIPGWRSGALCRTGRAPFPWRERISGGRSSI